MDMSATNCWDCPLTVPALTTLVIVLALLGWAAVWLMGKNLALWQALGAITLVITTFFVLTLPVYVPRWGVWRLGSERDVYHEGVVRAMLCVFAVLFVAGVTILLRRAGRACAVN
jgi:hypothetical protein